MVNQNIAVYVFAYTYNLISALYCDLKTKSWKFLTKFWFGHLQKFSMKISAFTIINWKITSSWEWNSALTRRVTKGGVCTVVFETQHMKGGAYPATSAAYSHPCPSSLRFKKVTIYCWVERVFLSSAIRIHDHLPHTQTSLIAPI